MPLTEEQAKSIKEQLFKQIESFPPEKRESIKSYISGMNPEQLEQFLIKNNLMKPSGEQEAEEENKEEENPKETKGKQCVYCLIGEKKIESLAIYEDKEYIAVLEINPITLGHTVIIPKKHLTETKLLKSKAFTIANKIGKHLVKKLKAENFQITSSDELKHAIINIIPRYKDQPVTFERKPAQKNELQETAMKIGSLSKKEKKATEKKPKAKIEEEKAKPVLLQLARRIP